MTLVPAGYQPHTAPDNGYGHVQPYQQPQYPQMPAPQPPVQRQQDLRLTEWADEARAAAALASSLVKTSFVPKAFQGRVEEATAAILTGAEMGLSPMASLRAIYVIHGTPGMYAKTMRAVVQSRGHEIWEHEATTTRVTVKGRRKGSDHVESVTWSMDRAKTAGVTNNDQYRKNPINMLRARATAEVCWLIASDALSGIAASVEELESGGFNDTDVPAPADDDKPAAKRTARRKPLEKADGAEPPLPPAQATIERNDDQPSATEDQQGDTLTAVSREQQKHMFALFRDLGYDGDDNRAQRLTIIGRILQSAQPIESSNDLTAGEADTVIAALRDRKAQREAEAQQGGDQ